MQGLKQFEFKVYGVVQGVGFRSATQANMHSDWTQRNAIRLGLKGWTRNTTSGEVEGAVQGQETGLKEFFEKIDKGPRLAHVTKVKKREIDLDSAFEDFIVKATASATVLFPESDA